MLRIQALPLLVTAFCFYNTWLYIRLVNLSGDIEKNPVPKSYSAQYLTICHWSLNDIAADNFIKVALLKSYLSVHIMDVACLSETYLDSSVRTDGVNLKSPGYGFVRADHLSNVKRGTAVAYYKSYLPLIDAKYLH